MTTKHTPGSWKLQTYRMYASQMAKAEYPIHAPKRGLIAKAYRKSDARLIAAAPELLDSAKDAVDRITSHLMLLKCDDEFIANETKTLRDAIAKATGEQK